MTLPDLIHQQQTSSVPGLSVFSAVSLTRDLFYFASWTDFTGCFVSLDQAKAFDRVEHPFMFGVLEAFEFPAELAKRLRLLYSDLNAVLFINGHQSAPSQLHGELGRDALSPQLFLFDA